MTFIRTIQSHPLLQALRARYRTLFSIHEIEENTMLQWLFGAVLLYFYVTFSQWISSPLLTAEADTTCWPYFQGCNSLHFLSYLQHGYSQTTFYMVLFGIMIAITYLMWKKRWTSAHALLLLLFAWKFFASFVLAMSIAGVYDYYHLIMTAVLLFLPYKEYFAKIVFVLLYFLSATVKFYPTWVLGNYFTAMEPGLPLLPDSLTAFWTESVIVSQVFGCWFLLSRNRVVQRIALVYFSIFHFYSGTLVLFNYPTVAELVLLVLFGPWYRHQWPPLTKRSIAGWVFVGIIVLFQTPGHLIPGDEKITMEGYRLGMWMFDANHQCISEYSVVYNEGVVRTPHTYAALPGAPCIGSNCVTERETKKQGSQWVEHIRVESPKAEYRCNPYVAWQSRMSLCSKNVERVAFTFDHSINGGPFYRIVDVPNMCDLTYKPFTHNTWIKEPPEAPAVGYPVQNFYF